MKKMNEKRHGNTQDIDLIEKILCEKDGQIAGYMENGIRRQLLQESISNASKQLTGMWSDGNVRLSQTVKEIESGFYKIEKEWTNISGQKKEFIFITCAKTPFIPNFSVIPCVLYDGNKFGNEGEPKWMTKDGKPWVFGYSRTGLPSCTVSESGDEYLSLFASDDDRQSLVSSCSLCTDDGGFYIHVIYYPEFEGPVAYTEKNRMSEAIDGTIPLEAGGVYKATSYLCFGEISRKADGVMKTYRNASAVFDLNLPQTLTNEDVWNRGVHYIKNKLYKVDNGLHLFCAGYMPDEEGNLTVREGWWKYGTGFGGQNSSLANVLIHDYIRNGSRDSLDIAVKVWDTWVENASLENGFINSYLLDDGNPMPDTTDCNNFGWALRQLLASYKLLLGQGIEKPLWLKRGLAGCDMLCSGYSEEYGFGKTWNSEGRMIDFDGTVGVYVIPALIEAYNVTGDDQYLKMAKKSLVFYDNRDLKNFSCSAGAIDSFCVDKETAWPMLHCALSIYSAAGEDEFIDMAQRAAYYILTWTYFHDVAYDFPCDFNRMGFRTKGATAVSAQHHHLDPWGSLMSGDFYKLYKATGDEFWHTWAKMYWNNSCLCISDGHVSQNGILNPIGAQGEAYFHTNWCFEGDYRAHRGSINQWFVAWPLVFRMNTLIWNDFRWPVENEQVRMCKCQHDSVLVQRS